MLARFNFAARLATGRGQPGDGAEVKAAGLFGTSNVLEPSHMVDRALAVAGGLELSPEARQALVEYIQSPLNYPPGFNGQPNNQQRQTATDARVRGLILLALASSDFQVG